MRVLLICPKKNTFVMRDLEMLQNIFGKVDLVEFSTENKLMLMLNLAKSFVKSAFGMGKYHYVMSWFVGYHSIFPFLFAKKSINLARGNNQFLLGFVPQIGFA